MAICVKPEVLEKYLEVMRHESEVFDKIRKAEFVPMSTYQELYKWYSHLVDQVEYYKAKTKELADKVEKLDKPQ